MVSGKSIKFQLSKTRPGNGIGVRVGGGVGVVDGVMVGVSVCVGDGAMVGVSDGVAVMVAVGVTTSVEVIVAIGCGEGIVVASSLDMALHPEHNRIPIKRIRIFNNA
jgi:hypothetical protein